MKHLYIILLSLFSSLVYSQDTAIDKDNCTITLSGETFKLYGEIKIVDDYEDISVKIVGDYEDIRIKIVDDYANSCGRIKIVDDYEDIRVKIVDDYEDIRVKIVDDYEGL